MPKDKVQTRKVHAGLSHGRWTVIKLSNNGDKISEIAQEIVSSLHFESKKSAHFSMTESKLYDVLNFSRANKLPVTCTLQQMPIVMRDVIMEHTIHETLIVKLLSFTASKGWEAAFSQQKLPTRCVFIRKSMDCQRD